MVAGVSKATKQLDSMFANVVNQTIAAEKQMRLVKLQSQRDALDVKNAVYKDLQNFLQNLQTSTRALISTQDSYALATAQKATVSNTPEGLTVLSATTSNDAIAGEYEISITNLAQAHRVASNRQSSSSSAVGATGTMAINGVGISVAYGDSLLTLASKINEATYGAGKEVVATVIDNRLVLTAKESGAENIMTLSGDPLVKLGIIDSSNQIVNELSPGKDAHFTVNGIEVTRSNNSGIDDVITGLTINLSPDAEGSNALLTVDTDVDNVKKAVNAMLSKYNEMVKYLQTKTQTVKVDEDTYTRGSLADDYAVRSMMSELADVLASGVSGDGNITSLYDLGVEVGHNLTFKLNDSTKFGTALSENRDEMLSFLDAKMTALDSVLNRYLGSESVMSYSLENLELQKKTLSSSINAEEERLSRREDLLIEQYSQMQTMMDELLNTQQTMNALLYGNYSSLLSSNSSKG